MYFSEQIYDDPTYQPGVMGLLDPMLIQAAQFIYHTYYQVHPERPDRPIGVAIDRRSYRGKLIFGRKPILLPKECFVPFQQLEVDG